MIKGMTVGSRGGKLSLLLGLALGVVAAALIVVYLSGAKGDGGGGSISGAKTWVVVATQDIPAGNRITAQMVERRQLPEGTVLSGAFDTAEAVVGQVTVVPVISGEQLVAAKITATGAAAVNQYGANPPLSLLLEPGQRAVSVELSSLIGAGGLIRPGDHVDVILSVKTATGEATANATGGSTGGSNQIAVTILQDLKVLAVDQNVAAQAAGGDGTAGSKDAEDSNAAATTVTFAATPVQAEVLALADMCRSNFEGRLAIALRGFGDEAKTVRTEWPADGAPPDCATLLGVKDLR